MKSSENLGRTEEGSKFEGRHKLAMEVNGAYIYTPGL